MIFIKNLSYSIPKNIFTKKYSSFTYKQCEYFNYCISYNKAKQNDLKKKINKLQKINDTLEQQIKNSNIDISTLKNYTHNNTNIYKIILTNLK